MRAAAVGRPAQPERTLLRLAAVRRLIAELIPFGCLAIGFLVAREWRPVVIVGFALASFGNYAMSVFYLHRVLGAAVGWVVALFPVILGNVVVGSVTIVGSATTRSPQNLGGSKTLTTTSWWIAMACLAVALALTVAAAVRNGERWIEHNQYNLPRHKLETYIRSRGTLARLWLPR